MKHHLDHLFKGKIKNFIYSKRKYSFFWQNGSGDSEERLKLKKLENFEIDGIAKYLKTCKNIVFINGAGISTSVGIPDFRSPKSGLYAQLEKIGLPPDIKPEDIFSIDYFKVDPRPFFTRMKWFFPLIKNPSISHFFQSLLVKKGVVKRIYTQNIDNLEVKVGIPQEKLVQGHGSVNTGHCMRCFKKYSFEWMKKELEINGFMSCENRNCQNSEGLVRPDIVMFGELMPEEFFEYEEDLNKADCLIVTGTSLQVYPFANLPNSVPNNCPRILINRDLVGLWENAANNPDKNYRDVPLIGDSDKIYLKLANLIGLKEELNNLINR